MDPVAARSFAQDLIGEYGLQGWRVELDNAMRRFGCCHHTRKTISLSRRLVELNSQTEVLDTILHEIAHAIAGPQAGHGREWQRVARSIGCSGDRCYSLARTVQPSPRFILECGYCGRKVPRIRAPRRKTACGTCCARFAGGQYDARFLLQCHPA
jgi:predicted SprT family Zn-dependent metalloprotease